MFAIDSKEPRARVYIYKGVGVRFVWFLRTNCPVLRFAPKRGGVLPQNVVRFAPKQ